MKLRKRKFNNLSNWLVVWATLAMLALISCTSSSSSSDPRPNTGAPDLAVGNLTFTLGTEASGAEVTYEANKDGYTGVYSLTGIAESRLAEGLTLTLALPTGFEFAPAAPNTAENPVEQGYTVDESNPLQAVATISSLTGVPQVTLGEDGLTVWVVFRVQRQGQTDSYTFAVRAPYKRMFQTSNVGNLIFELALVGSPNTAVVETDEALVLEITGLTNRQDEDLSFSVTVAAEASSNIISVSSVIGAFGSDGNAEPNTRAGTYTLPDLQRTGKEAVPVMNMLRVVVEDNSVSPSTNKIFTLRASWAAQPILTAPTFNMIYPVASVQGTVTEQYSFAERTTSLFTPSADGAIVLEPENPLELYQSISNFEFSQLTYDSDIFELEATSLGDANNSYVLYDTNQPDLANIDTLRFYSAGTQVDTIVMKEKAYPSNQQTYEVHLAYHTPVRLFTTDWDATLVGSSPSNEVTIATYPRANSSNVVKLTGLTNRVDTGLAIRFVPAVVQDGAGNPVSTFPTNVFSITTTGDELNCVAAPDDDAVLLSCTMPDRPGTDAIPETNIGTIVVTYANPQAPLVKEVTNTYQLQAEWAADGVVIPRARFISLTYGGSNSLDTNSGIGMTFSGDTYVVSGLINRRDDLDRSIRLPPVPSYSSFEYDVSPAGHSLDPDTSELIIAQEAFNEPTGTAAYDSDITRLASFTLRKKSDSSVSFTFNFDAPFFFGQPAIPDPILEFSYPFASSRVYSNEGPLTPQPVTTFDNPSQLKAELGLYLAGGRVSFKGFDRYSNAGRPFDTNIFELVALDASANALSTNAPPSIVITSSDPHEAKYLLREKSFTENVKYYALILTLQSAPALGADITPANFEVTMKGSQPTVSTGNGSNFKISGLTNRSGEDGNGESVSVTFTAPSGFLLSGGQASLTEMILDPDREGTGEIIGATNTVITFELYAEDNSDVRLSYAIEKPGYARQVGVSRSNTNVAINRNDAVSVDYGGQTTTGRYSTITGSAYQVSGLTNREDPERTITLAALASSNYSYDVSREGYSLDGQGRLVLAKSAINEPAGTFAYPDNITLASFTIYETAYPANRSTYRIEASNFAAQAEAVLPSSLTFTYPDTSGSSYTTVERTYDPGTAKWYFDYLDTITFGSGGTVAFTAPSEYNTSSAFELIANDGGTEVTNQIPTRAVADENTRTIATFMVREKAYPSNAVAVEVRSLFSPLAAPDLTARHVAVNMAGSVPVVADSSDANVIEVTGLTNRSNEAIHVRVTPPFGYEFASSSDIRDREMVVADPDGVGTEAIASTDLATIILTNSSNYRGTPVTMTYTLRATFVAQEDVSPPAVAELRLQYGGATLGAEEGASNILGSSADAITYDADTATYMVAGLTNRADASRWIVFADASNADFQYTPTPLSAAQPSTGTAVVGGLNDPDGVGAVEEAFLLSTLLIEEKAYPQNSKEYRVMAPSLAAQAEAALSPNTGLRAKLSATTIGFTLLDEISDSPDLVSYRLRSDVNAPSAGTIYGVYGLNVYGGTIPVFYENISYDQTVFELVNAQWTNKTSGAVSNIDIGNDGSVPELAATEVGIHALVFTIRERAYPSNLKRVEGQIHVAIFDDADDYTVTPYLTSSGVTILMPTGNTDGSWSIELVGNVFTVNNLTNRIAGTFPLIFVSKQRPNTKFPNRNISLSYRLGRNGPEQTAGITTTPNNFRLQNLSMPAGNGAISTTLLTLILRDNDPANPQPVQEYFLDINFAAELPPPIPSADDIVVSYGGSNVANEAGEFPMLTYNPQGFYEVLGLTNRDDSHERSITIGDLGLNADTFGYDVTNADYSVDAKGALTITNFADPTGVDAFDSVDLATFTVYEKAYTNNSRTYTIRGIDVKAQHRISADAFPDTVAVTYTYPTTGSTTITSDQKINFNGQNSLSFTDRLRYEDDGRLSVTPFSYDSNRYQLVTDSENGLTNISVARTILSNTPTGALPYSHGTFGFNIYLQEREYPANSYQNQLNIVFADSEVVPASFIVELGSQTVAGTVDTATSPITDTGTTAMVNGVEHNVFEVMGLTNVLNEAIEVTLVVPVGYRAEPSLPQGEVEISFTNNVYTGYATADAQSSQDLATFTLVRLSDNAVSRYVLRGALAEEIP